MAGGLEVGTGQVGEEERGTACGKMNGRDGTASRGDAHEEEEERERCAAEEDSVLKTGEEWLWGAEERNAKQHEEEGESVRGEQDGERVQEEEEEAEEGTGVGDDVGDVGSDVCQGDE
jgi:hypothetical protein